jgi:hypothetical protein
LGEGFAADRSPIAAKPEFYDPLLVGAIRKAAVSSTTLDAFATALRQALSVQAGRLRGLFEESSRSSTVNVEAEKARLQEWAALPPSFEIWSGVRELEFLPSLASIFVRDGATIPPQLDFMLQVAFTSDPTFGPNRITRDEDAGTYTDPKPWEFPTIRQKIRDAVARSLDADDKVVLANSNEFALLQRFFRMGFAGQLGEAFPVARLDALAAELERSARPADWTTPRWNPRPGGLEMQALQTLMVAQRSGEQGGDLPTAEIEACRALAKQNLDRRQAFRQKIEELSRRARPGDAGWKNAWAAAWTREESDQLAWEDKWQKAATALSAAAQRTASSAPVLRAVDETVSRTTAALKVRRALGVSKDERLGDEVAIGLRKMPVL